MVRFVRRVLLMIAAVGVLVAGCGPRLPAGKVRFVGTVTRGGSPVTVGGVNFMAVEGTETGTGRIQPDGSFEATLSPGSFKVAVTASKGVVDAKTGRVDGLEWLVPQKYADARTSGLSIEVSQGMSPVSLVIPE